MADAFDGRKEILDRSEADAAFPETAAGHDFRLQFVVFAEKQPLSYSDLSPGAHQTLPFVGFAAKLGGSGELRFCPRRKSREAGFFALRGWAFAPLLLP